LRIVVLGYVVRGPLAGLAWHYLQFVLGLSQLGHDVYFFEDSDDYPACYHPDANTLIADPGYGLKFLSDCFAALDLPQRWAYYDAHRDAWHGLTAHQVHDILATADLCLNLSGVNPLRPWLMRVPVRTFVDTDPAFTQVRHLTNPAARALAERHTEFFSFGENLPGEQSAIPDDGLCWQPTRQPIVCDAWPARPGPADGRFTSVLLWEAYPGVEYQGQRYGPKSDSFMAFLDLPSRTGPIFELAFGSSTAPGRLMEGHGWSLTDPRPPTRTLRDYQRFIHGSKAEFGIAKHGYVVSRSGWFSERSAAYLASGRPVIVQDTGFSSWLPCGAGVLSFRTMSEAVDAIASVNSRYEWHCRNARELAEAFFDSRAVLTRLIEASMSGVAGHGS
jgi:hypothetical protein